MMKSSLRNVKVEGVDGQGVSEPTGGKSCLRASSFKGEEREGQREGDVG